MKKKKPFLTVLLLLIAVCAIGFGGIVSTSADDEWSWANYGFSDTAIANPDLFEKTSYLIGGYVATVNYLNPLPDSYIYNGTIVLDTEGVALRTRFSWVNTESGYKSVADFSDGIAIYPMDESIDIAIVTAAGVQRFSFPVPAAYDCMKANDFMIMDDGSHMVLTVCRKSIAVLKFDGTRNANGQTYYANITVTDGNGYVYGRLTDSLVLKNGGYIGYSSQVDRALILVKEHSLNGADIAFDAFPEEKETTEDWVPETEPRETEEITEPETSPETVTDSSAATVPETNPETIPETISETQSETVAQSDSAPVTTADTNPPVATAPESGCGSVMGTGTLLLMSVFAAAAILGKKKE